VCIVNGPSQHNATHLIWKSAWDLPEDHQAEQPVVGKPCFCYNYCTNERFAGRKGGNLTRHIFELQYNPGWVLKGLVQDRLSHL
jgi:hypothetical protein